MSFREPSVFSYLICFNVPHNGIDSGSLISTVLSLHSLQHSIDDVF